MPDGPTEETGTERVTVFYYCYIAFMVGLLLGSWLAKKNARQRVAAALADL